MKKYKVKRLEFNPKINSWDTDRLAEEMETSINETLKGEHQLHSIYETQREVEHNGKTYEMLVLTIIYSE